MALETYIRFSPGLHKKNSNVLDFFNLFKSFPLFFPFWSGTVIQSGLFSPIVVGEMVEHDYNVAWQSFRLLNETVDSDKNGPLHMSSKGYTIIVQHRGPNE